MDSCSVRWCYDEQQQRRQKMFHWVWSQRTTMTRCLAARLTEFRERHHLWVCTRTSEAFGMKLNRLLMVFLLSACFYVQCMIALHMPLPPSSPHRRPSSVIQFRVFYICLLIDANAWIHFRDGQSAMKYGIIYEIWLRLWFACFVFVSATRKKKYIESALLFLSLSVYLSVALTRLRRVLWMSCLCIQFSR